MKPTTSSATAAITNPTGLVRKPMAEPNFLNKEIPLPNTPNPTFMVWNALTSIPNAYNTGPIAIAIAPMATTNL